MKDVFKGYLRIILATILWGTSPLWIRNINLDPYQTTFIRTLIGSLILFIFVRKLDIDKIKKDLKQIIIGGIGVCGGFIFYFLAIKLTTVSHALLSFYTLPLFVAILAPLLIKEELDKFTLFAVPIGFLGVFLILPTGFSLQDQNAIGILFGLLAAFSQAFSIIYAKYLTKNHKSNEIVFYQLFITALVLLPFSIKPIQINTNLVINMALLITFGTILGYVIFVRALEYVKAQHAEILGYLEVLFAIIFAAIFLKELPSSNSIFGGIFIITAGIIVVLSKK